MDKIQDRGGLILGESKASIRKVGRDGRYKVTDGRGR